MVSGDKKAQFISQWNKIKIEIQLTTNKSSLYFREKEVWWASLGANLGHEEDGKNKKFERPVLILRKFNKHLMLVIPLTSKIKENNKYYFKCFLNNQSGSAIISQIRIISSKRLIRRMGDMSNMDFYKIKDLIKNLI